MSSNSSDAQPEYVEALAFNALYFDMAVIEALFYGIYVALFFVTAYTIVSRHQLKLRALGLHIGIVLLFIFSTIHMGTRWTIVKNAFIANGETPLTTYDYLGDPPFGIEILESVVYSTSTLIADSILVWRTWLIWGRDWRVALIPGLATLSGSVMGYISIFEAAQFLLNKPIPPNSYVRFANPYFYLTLATTVICTSLILLRIFWMTRGGIARLSSYRAIIEMIVESAALYTVLLIAFIATGPSNITDGYPQTILGPMTVFSIYTVMLVAHYSKGIAPTLIVCRVALGLSRPDSTWATTGAGGATQSSGHVLSDIRFNFNFRSKPESADSGPVSTDDTQTAFARSTTGGSVRKESKYAEV
uniref:Uncharacterized protein n=1 Tax=Mycena chlorophos TaxID=658473 RepID=A0ABQ0L1J7_MYCCL|nr:predicted protein [Mycena chlorophos]